MKNPLSRFPVRIRLLSILIAFMMPVGLLSYLLHVASTAQVGVARDEIAGVRYITPLVALLHDVGAYQMTLLTESQGRKSEKSANTIARTVDERLSEFSKLDAELGAQLKMTVEDLANAKRPPISAAALAKSWQSAKEAKYSGAIFNQLLSDIEGIISYVEGTSQLALDPDIDSYMLMAATIELLPRTLHALAHLESEIFKELSTNQNSISVAKRPDIFFIQKTIQDFLLPSTLGNIEKTLDTDAETNGPSPTLKATMTEAVASYQKTADTLMEATKGLLADDKKVMAPEAFVGIVSAVHDTCYNLSAKGLNELKTLLEIRIQGVLHRELVVFSFVIVGIALSLLLYFVAVASIIGPVQRVQGSMERIVGGDTDFEIETDTAKNETSALGRALESLRATVAEAFKHKQMIEDMPINVMVIDPKNGSKITYANKTSVTTLRSMETHLPVKADNIIGSSFDVFHKVSPQQRNMLATGDNLPSSDIIKIGSETLQLKISAIRNAKGNYIGPMVAWTVITGQEKLAADFEKNVLGVVDILNKSTAGLNSSAESLSNTAESTSRLSTAVAGAATQASANVQTVAAATEELTASIGEISRQVKEANQISNSAVKEAEQTNQSMRQLAENAQKIGEVITLINNIAGQTNLLALNATIEAARAGEAGKGFAVVASEVKNLAAQTAKATEEISSQVQSIQASTTAAVEAIGRIGNTIENINRIQSTIATAVEEQGAATEEISRNVAEASTGTSDVSKNIVDVTRSSQATGQSATEVSRSAQELSQQSIRLHAEVDKFMKAVRSA